jgi:hypothetical protein
MRKAGEMHPVMEKKGGSILPVSVNLPTDMPVAFTSICPSGERFSERVATAALEVVTLGG